MPEKLGVDLSGLYPVSEGKAPDVPFDLA